VLIILINLHFNTLAVKLLQLQVRSIVLTTNCHCYLTSLLD